MVHGDSRALALAARVVRVARVIDQGRGAMLHGGVRDHTLGKGGVGRYQFTRRRYDVSTTAIYFEAGPIIAQLS